MDIKTSKIMKIYKAYEAKVGKCINELKSTKYKVQTPLWWRTRLYKPYTVFKKIKYI